MAELWEVAGEKGRGWTRGRDRAIHREDTLLLSRPESSLWVGLIRSFTHSFPSSNTSNLCPFGGLEHWFLKCGPKVSGSASLGVC